MCIDLSHQGEDLKIQSVIRQSDNIVESLHLQIEESSETLLPQSNCVFLNQRTKSNHLVSQQLRSALQKRRLADAECKPLERQPKTIISFLGTGSASPSRHRSNSAILFQFKSFPHETSILLDAGECCLAQLFQSCQGDIFLMRSVLLSLSVVWISHHHADHHCGLSHLLEEMFRCNRNNKLLVIAPATVISYHQYLACVGGFDEVVEFIPIEYTLDAYPPTNLQVFSQIKQQIRTATNNTIDHLQSIRVHHCRDSFGVILKLSTQEKFVYSGDCRPSRQLISPGMNCDLLIHEATFEDDRIEDAKLKKHSTISEGIQMGVEMLAHHTILTHLSQRYPRRTISVQEEQNVTIAHDFLRVVFL